MTEKLYDFYDRNEYEDGVLRMAGIDYHMDIAGPYLCAEIFTQGCIHSCKDCFNPETHSVNGGREFEVDDLVEVLEESTPYKRLTISGGEPLMQAKNLYHLCRKLKERGWFILCYTGFTWEQIMDLQRRDYTAYIDILSMLFYVDVLIDGRFEKDKALPIEPGKFIGSSNQRAILPRESYGYGRIIEWEKPLKLKIRDMLGLGLGGELYWLKSEKEKSNLSNQPIWKKLQRCVTTALTRWLNQL